MNETKSITVTVEFYVDVPADLDLKNVTVEFASYRDISILDGGKQIKVGKEKVSILKHCTVSVTENEE